MGFPGAVRRIAALACLLAGLLAPPAGAVGPDATRRALEREMRRAGPASGALAVDLDSGGRVYALRAGTARVPASVEKLYTTATALRRLGASARLTTKVSATAVPDAAGTVAGDLYLRGGGDPTFDAPDLGRLVDEVEAAGVATVTGRVLGDETAFDAFRGPPSSGYRLSGYVGPLSALTFNRGLTGKRSPYFQAQPARFAARALTRELRRRGVIVARAAAVGATPAGAVPVAEWASPPMVELARLTNVPSDNFSAETLLKVLGAQFAGVGQQRGRRRRGPRRAGAPGPPARRRRRLGALAGEPDLPAPGGGPAARHGRGGRPSRARSRSPAAPGRWRRACAGPPRRTAAGRRRAASATSPPSPATARRWTGRTSPSPSS